jgi:trk system potassium uptake protein TrkA
VIERDLNIANNLSGSVVGAHANLDVIHGDFLDRNILTEIGINEHHIAIAALDDDHISIAAALLANDMGVTRTGLILKDSDLVKVTQRMGITFAVDIKRVAVDNILAHIHTRASGAYAILSNIPDIVGISLPVSSETKFVGKRISNAGLPDWARIAFIQRRNTIGGWETLRPSRDKTIVDGDRLILFCRPDRVTDLEKRFKV